MQAQAEDNYVLFSCEGARDTEDRMFVMDSGASVHNAEQGDLSSDTMDTLRRSNSTCDLPRMKHKFFMISICS